MTGIEWDDQALVGLGVVLAAVTFLWWAVRRTSRWIHSRDITADSALTVLAAAVGAAFSAQGMWGFFRSTLHLPISLTALGFFFFELVQVVCALRARRKMLDPTIGKTGAEGVMLWISAALTGFFSATHATTWPEVTFRLLVPSVAAWLWHQQMGLEHRQATGKLSGINWRMTPERILIRLGLADPTDRTAAEVSAERTLMTLAVAARKARTPRWGRRWLARRRLDAALQRATEYARLATDPASQALLNATLGVLNGADQLARLTPPAPWSTPTGPNLETAFRDLADLDLLDIDDRTKALLTRTSTAPTGARLAWAPLPSRSVEMTTQRPASGTDLNRDSDWPVGDDRPAHGDEIDPRSTVASTIREMNARGVGEQRIADDLGVTRHWVRKILKGDSQPAPTAINGHPVGVDR